MALFFPQARKLHLICPQMYLGNRWKFISRHHAIKFDGEINFYSH